jgi:hypothetical protein
LIDRLQAKIAVAEVEFVLAGGHEVAGHATYGSFLRARCAASTSESRRVATRVKKLGRWPEILDAWQAGVLCGAQVDVLAAKVPAHHVARFAEDCSAHVEFLTGMSTETTIAKLADWLERADAVDDREDTEIGTEPLVEIRRFYVAHHQQPPSAGRPDRGVIVADVAALFRAILRGDGVRTAAQLETYLAAQPELGALERGLFCDAFDGHGGTARTLDGHSVTDTLLRHVTRDGILERLLRTGHRIIDHGRSVRVFTESQKRAMAARDAGSRISGESPWGCHAHHSPPFDEGGTTDINTGYLKTRREHLDHHRRGCTDRINPDGSVTLISPEGRERDTRSPMWPGDGPTLPVHTTAAPAPALPFTHDSDADDVVVGVESIDWNTIEPPTEPQHEDGWEPSSSVTTRTIPPRSPASTPTSAAATGEPSGENEPAPPEPGGGRHPPGRRVTTLRRASPACRESHFPRRRGRAPESSRRPLIRPRTRARGSSAC